MKCVVPVVLFILLSLTLPAQNSGITFETAAWEQILVKAGEEEKLVFLDAFASWCGPCKWMDAHVFEEEVVGEYMNENFVNAKIDMEEGEGPELANQYGVRAYPTYLFVNSKGELVHRFCGSMPAERFLHNVKLAHNPDSAFVARESKYQSIELLNPNQAIEYISMLERACLNTHEAIANIYDGISQETDILKQWAGFFAEYPPAFETSFFDFAVANYLSYTSESRQKLERGIEKAAGTYLLKTLRADKQNYPIAIKAVKALELRNEQKVLALSDYYYYQSNGDWEQFAAATQQLLKGERSENAAFLNSAAWTVYENVASDNTDLLNKALNWAKQSVELDKGYANMDTYAALLYKTGNRKKADAIASEAIEIARENGQDYSGTKDLMEKY